MDLPSQTYHVAGPPCGNPFTRLTWSPLSGLLKVLLWQCTIQAIEDPISNANEMLQQRQMRQLFPSSKKWVEFWRIFEIVLENVGSIPTTGSLIILHQLSVGRRFVGKYALDENKQSKLIRRWFHPTRNHKNMLESMSQLRQIPYSNHMMDVHLVDGCEILRQNW